MPYWEEYLIKERCSLSFTGTAVYFLKTKHTESASNLNTFGIVEWSRFYMGSLPSKQVCHQKVSAERII